MKKFIPIIIVMIFVVGIISYQNFLIIGSPTNYTNEQIDNNSNDSVASSTNEQVGHELVAQPEIDLVVSPGSWKLYKYFGYQIAFPGDPEITTSNTEITDSSIKMMSVTYAAVDKDSAAYFLTVTTIPEEIPIPDNRKLLENAILTSVKNVNGKLIAVIDTRNHTGIDSLDFVIEIPDGPRTYIGRNIFKENTLYEMRVVHLTSKSGEFRGFVDSLKLQ